MQVPLELRMKVLKKAANMCKQAELELVLVKIWKIARQLAKPEQIGYLHDASSVPNSDLISD